MTGPEAIPTEAVEAAAVTLCATGRNDDVWRILTESEREEFRKDARNALAAAWPLLAAHMLGEARPVSEHSVTLDFGTGSDWPSRRLTCNAPADALCHASHDCGCEEWTNERIEDGVPVHDVGQDTWDSPLLTHAGTFKAECNLVDFFDGSDEVLRGEVTVPVQPRWEGDYYTFDLAGGAA